MREILFRGIRTDNGEWVEGYLTKRPSSVQIGCSSPWYIDVPPRDPDDAGGTYNVFPETVGQYTGLTDKNGTRIFEGDICRNIKTGEVVSVRWHGTMAGYVWSKRKDNCQNLFDFGELFRAYDKYEVIGNIYDNPELLKGGV